MPNAQETCTYTNSMEEMARRYRPADPEPWQPHGDLRTVGLNCWCGGVSMPAIIFTAYQVEGISTGKGLFAWIEVEEKLGYLRRLHMSVIECQ